MNFIQISIFGKKSPFFRLKHPLATLTLTTLKKDKQCASDRLALPALRESEPRRHHPREKKDIYFLLIDDDCFFFNF